jgi:hypothetical protein
MLIAFAAHTSHAHPHTIYIYIYIYIYLHKNIHTYICIFIRTHTHTHTLHIHTLIHIIHTYIYEHYRYTHMHINKYTHTLMPTTSYVYLRTSSRTSRVRARSAGSVSDVIPIFAMTALRTSLLVSFAENMCIHVYVCVSVVVSVAAPRAALLLNHLLRMYVCT